MYRAGPSSRVIVIYSQYYGTYRYRNNAFKRSGVDEGKKGWSERKVGLIHDVYWNSVFSSAPTVLPPCCAGKLENFWGTRVEE